ncbi:unnamed protein product, partial [Brassica rapa subsp. trilocularis]
FPHSQSIDTISRIPRHPSSYSSSIKFENLGLTSSLRRLVVQTSLKVVAEIGSVSKSVSLMLPGLFYSTSVRPVTHRMSADLGFLASTPPRPRSGESN